MNQLQQQRIYDSLRVLYGNAKKFSEQLECTLTLAAIKRILGDTYVIKVDDVPGEFWDKPIHFTKIKKAIPITLFGLESNITIEHLNKFPEDKNRITWIR